MGNDVKLKSTIDIDKHHIPEHAHPSPYHENHLQIVTILFAQMKYFVIMEKKNLIGRLTK